MACRFAQAIVPTSGYLHLRSLHHLGDTNLDYTISVARLEEDHGDSEAHSR